MSLAAFARCKRLNPVPSAKLSMEMRSSLAAASVFHIQITSLHLTAEAGVFIIHVALFRLVSESR